MIKRVFKLISIIIFFIILEIIFEIAVIGNINNIILKTLFIVPICIMLDIITSLFKEKTNKILYIILTFLITIIFNIYFIYYKLLGSILSLVSLKNGVQQAMPFSSILFTTIFENWPYILLFFIPFILVVLVSLKINYQKTTKRSIIIKTVIVIVMHFITIGLIHITSKTDEIYSAKNIYYNINNPIESVKCFGLPTTIRLDLQRIITNFKEKAIYTYTDSEGQENAILKEDYNMIDISFENLIKNENNDEIKEVYSYLKTQKPSNKNKYTGKFKNKNLIVFVAESFSNLAIRQDITPTLYKLANQGFKFKNFYTPLFPVSTADGEYLTDTSLIPVEGIWTIENVAGKYFPYTYANALKKEGYKTYAYHNYNYKYYHREKYFPTMGYDTYLGQGNGLEKRMDFSAKPSSDHDMVKTTLPDYINQDKFIAYYMTMSGHMNYDKTNGMVNKNWEKVKDLPYSDKAKAYLATQIELDKAVEEVLKTLEKNHKLKDTVIAITGDHYPYGLTFEEMQELSEKPLDDFERFHMPFILYNSEIEDTEITKYASSLDVLPTILNLFGVEYDSRLLMGRDIFSDSEPLIIFSERSFITNKGRYNAYTETFEGEEVEEEYIKKIKKEIYYKYRYSRLIFENNLYNIVKEIK